MPGLFYVALAVLGLHGLVGCVCSVPLTPHRVSLVSEQGFEPVDLLLLAFHVGDDVGLTLLRHGCSLARLARFACVSRRRPSSRLFFGLELIELGSDTRVGLRAVVDAVLVRDSLLQLTWFLA